MNVCLRAAEPEWLAYLNVVAGVLGALGGLAGAFLAIRAYTLAKHQDRVAAQRAATERRVGVELQALRDLSTLLDDPDVVRTLSDVPSLLFEERGMQSRLDMLPLPNLPTWRALAGAPDQRWVAALVGAVWDDAAGQFVVDLGEGIHEPFGGPRLPLESVLRERLRREVRAAIRLRVDADAG